MLRMRWHLENVTIIAETSRTAILGTSAVPALGRCDLNTLPGKVRPTHCLRRFRYISLLLAFAIAACENAAHERKGENQDQSTPQRVVESYVHALADGRYEQAVELVRGADGGPLSQQAKSALVRNWKQSLGGEGGKVHISRIVMTGRRPRGSSGKSFRADEGVDITLRIEGTSETKCWELPADQVVFATARVASAWYVVPLEGFGEDELMFLCSST